jgi:hypothetical protein
MLKKCVVLMCNNVDIYKINTLRTINELRTVGAYKDDLVLIYDDELVDILGNQSQDNFKNKLIEQNVILKYFPKINRDKFTQMFRENPFVDGDKREITKTFQFHKFYLFSEYFKQWDKIFYIDAGMHIFKPIDKIINLECTNKLLAHSDAYPYYKSKLNCQFESKAYPDIYKKLKSNFKLNVDFFQTCILVFDTNIIKSNTFDELIKLSEEYFISKTNEQGIMNLYFNLKFKIWNQIQIKDDYTYYYDFWERSKHKKCDYIMLKRIRFG